jgi:rare lipoprotein A
MNAKKTLEFALVIMICFTSGTLAHATYQKTSEVINQRIGEPAQMITGTASWYSFESPGIRKTTANMETFDDTAMTCAMWNTPFHQQLRITNLKNGRSVIVRVNDRGPHKRLVRAGRIIDLSKAAFQKIANLNEGLINVKVEFL